VTVRQAAQRLEVSISTVYALVASGKLRCSRIGLGRGVIRISEEQLVEYLRAAELVVAPPPAPPAGPGPKLKHIRLG
jgi:excisionase family DNA binding protein